MKIQMNKKSLIQIAVLVVLVVAAAGAFLFQQEGGLSMLGLGEPPAAPPPPVAKPAAPPKPAEPVIPAQPAAGELQGAAFAVSKAVIEAGTLSLAGGEAEVRISRMGAQWEAPAGKKFKLINASGANLPLVVVRRATTGAQPTASEYGDKYTLLLEFGQEKEGKLPGKIYLGLPGAAKPVVAGTFDAQITGFRIIDGKPDLSADSADTLQFLALRELLKDDPDKALNDTILRDIRYVVGDGVTVPSGYLEASYRIGTGALAVKRFQFVKEKNEWRVWRTLRTDQIDEANPYKAPSLKTKPESLFPYLAAKKLETDTHKKYPKKGISVTDYRTRYSLKHKLGECEVTYRIEGSEQASKTTYLMRQKPGGWVLERTLGGKERLNVDTGRIEKAS